MKTKLFSICMMIFTISIVNAQLPLPSEIIEKKVKTMNGTMLQLSCIKGSKGDKGYLTSITQFYYDAIDGQNVFTTICVYESNLDLLYQEFSEVYDYYIKWGITAKENGVRDVEKTIPVTITAFHDIYCSAYANPTEKNSSFIFRVRDYEPFCVLRISLGFYNRRYYVTHWIFSEKEVLGITNEIDDILKKQKEYDYKKQRVIDLFK